MLSVEAVQIALASLCKNRIHPSFAGYLCLKESARASGEHVSLKPSFKGFFEGYLAVSDGTAKKPYLLPFSDSETREEPTWFNSNVAGSYAPSSIRAQSPLRKVCTFSNGGRVAEFQLVPQHWEHAKTGMLFGEKISAVALAVFLYRDFRFAGENATAQDLVKIFRDEFGYREQKNEEVEQFNALFIESHEILSNMEDIFSPLAG